MDVSCGTTLAPVTLQPIQHLWKCSVIYFWPKSTWIMNGYKMYSGIVWRFTVYLPKQDETNGCHSCSTYIVINIWHLKRKKQWHEFFLGTKVKNMSLITKNPFISCSCTCMTSNKKDKTKSFEQKWKIKGFENKIEFFRTHLFSSH